MMTGDRQQQQSIQNDAEGTKDTTSILHQPKFYRLVQHFDLKVQYRCLDQDLQNAFNHMRYYKPTQSLLNMLQKDRVVCHKSEPTPIDIENVLKENPTAIILTVTRAAANKVNQVAAETLFTKENALS